MTTTNCEGSGSLGTPECSPTATVPGGELDPTPVPTTLALVPAPVPAPAALPLTGGDVAGLVITGVVLVALGWWMAFKSKMPYAPESGTLRYWAPEDGWD